MKLSRVLCCLVSALCLASAVPPFPVIIPLIPTLDTPAQAYGGLLITFKVIVLSVLFATYQQYFRWSSTTRAPTGRKKRGMTATGNSTEEMDFPYPTLAPSELALLLDNIATADRHGCVLQLICRLSSLPPEQLSRTQKSIVDFLLLLPNFVHTTPESPRARLMMAANVGRNSATPFQSCTYISQACPHDMYPLASFL